ncbi:MAG: imidazole glycerol phosphate synthase subunit HisF [Ginsengibacter sp.]
MLAKRIIACLDIKDGRTVKGIHFENLRDAGDPVSMAEYYSEQGADELVFLDITATIEKRKTMVSLVRKLAEHLKIPFTVGGGISSVENISELLQNGADKISINTAAFKNPELIREAAEAFGSQCIVLAIDTKLESDGEWYVYLNGGRLKTEIKAVDWAVRAVELGAGEILLTSMNNDGMEKGFALDITGLISDKVSVPVIASGGAGTMEHFAEVFEKSNAGAALAAGVFHFNKISIPELKTYLKNSNILVRN